MQGVVLAGGQSSRFWPLNRRHKSLVSIAGRTLLGRTLDALVGAGVTDIVVVQGPDRDAADIVDVPEGADVTFVVQDEPAGMGDAVDRARPHLDGRFVVTGPYRLDAGRLLDAMRPVLDGRNGAVVGTVTDHPERYGMLAVDGDAATGIVEKPGPGEAPSDLKAVSTYVLSPAFFDHLDAVADHEYSFEDALDRYMASHDVGVARLDREPPSLKYPWDLFGFVDRVLADLEPRVADTADVADSAVLDGNVVVEPGARIYENAVVRGPVYIGRDVTVGNNAVVRDGTVLEDGATVGANAEVRGSVFQPGASCHSGFVGDSVLDRDVAVGAGTVTANRRVREADGTRGTVEVHVHAADETVDTGRTRLGAIVGERADIGTQANLMPGVCIGAGSFVGPSALVRHNVDEDRTYFTTMEGREFDRR